MIELILVSLFTVFLTMFLITNTKRIREFEEVKVPNSPLKETHFISVIIPMRNEERNARRCITSLINQDYPNYEVIAVDDVSTDNTSRILEELSIKYPNLRVVRGSLTPLGWIGKNHALWQGVQVARGEWFLFIDADTYSEPYALRSALFYAQEFKVDMLSIFPFQELYSFWERVIQPIIFATIAHALPHGKVNNPNQKEAAANGQFILIRREVYEAVGGHETIRDKIVEDFALAKLVKGRGYRLRVARGRQLIRTRMYTSLQEVWEGWTKNLFLGIEKDWKRLVWAVLMLSALGFLPFFLLAKSVVTLFSGVGLIQFIIFVESFWLVFFNLYVAWERTKAYSIPAYYAAFFPLSALAFIGIMLSSAYRIVSGKGIVWKGRRYGMKTII